MRMVLAIRCCGTFFGGFRYHEVVAEFADVIVAQLFGHTHSDEWRVENPSEGIFYFDIFLDHFTRIYLPHTPLTRSVTYSTQCPCLLGANWCLQFFRWYDQFTFLGILDLGLILTIRPAVAVAISRLTCPPHIVAFSSFDLDFVAC